MNWKKLKKNDSKVDVHKVAGKVAGNLKIIVSILFGHILQFHIPTWSYKGDL